MNKLHSTDDISDADIYYNILNANNLYKSIISTIYNRIPVKYQEQLQGSLIPCCDDSELHLLGPLVRVLMEYYPTNPARQNGRRLPIGYASSAVLYYYYQVVLMDMDVNTFLKLGYLRMFKVSENQINNVHEIVNNIVISDDYYATTIRQALLRFNTEEFYGGHRQVGNKQVGRMKQRKTKTKKNKNKENI